MTDEWTEVPVSKLTLEQVDEAQVLEVKEVANFLRLNGEGWGFHFGGDSRISVNHERGQPVSFRANEVRFFQLGNEIFVARA